jgi:hypothetical protein
MYSKAEAAQLKHEFWIAFGKYMSLHSGSEGLRINWINYHTGHKHLYFRMEVNKTTASISIQLTHPDELMRELYFDRFLSFRSIIHDALNEEWSWELNAADDFGKPVSRIHTELRGVNIFDKATWPEIISFLKPRIIKLDEVWTDIKDAFEDLR